jgi:hypothetical protein
MGSACSTAAQGLQLLPFPFSTAASLHGTRNEHITVLRKHLNLPPPIPELQDVHVVYVL